MPSTITARRTRRYTSTRYIRRTIIGSTNTLMDDMDDRGRSIFQPPNVLMAKEKVLANWPAEMSHSSMENVILRPKEQARLQVLNNLLAEQITLYQAAELMGVTTRLTRRILAAYRRNGAAALAHGLWGRKPPNAIPEPVRSRVVHLAGTIYQGATILISRSCSVNERASTSAGPPCGASWSTPL